MMHRSIPTDDNQRITGLAHGIKRNSAIGRHGEYRVAVAGENAFDAVRHAHAATCAGPWIPTEHDALR